TPLSDEQREYVETIRVSGEALLGIINDILDFSKIESGMLELELHPVELPACVEEAFDMVSGKAAEKDLDLLYVLGDEVPAWIMSDAARLRQILVNLLANAVKFTEQGEICVSVSCTARAGNRYKLQFAVRDTGIGIPRDMLGKVFDMFTQVAQSLDRSQGGLGIGLTLVKRLVELHGGTVEARSAGPGKGSEFIIRMPEHASAEAAPRIVVLAEGPAPAKAQRVLVADDNRDAADSLAFMLRVAGHEVRIAYDGQQALDLAETFRPSLALVDIGMPRLNGYETARRLREKPYGAELTLIALTGWGQPDDRNRSLAAGFDHHVVKPIDPPLLERLLAAPAKKKGPACRGEDGPRGGVELVQSGLQAASRPDLR
ncbi:MAG TPA: ATP-binding protein, partial [Burkholderiales bacterium]|nr:ATP-binding protein [Burkholderiales bacterium]